MRLGGARPMRAETDEHQTHGGRAGSAVPAWSADQPAPTLQLVGDEEERSSPSAAYSSGGRRSSPP